MVDRLDSARRRYEQFRITPGEPAVGRQAEEMSLWLEQDVCAVVEDLVGRPDFQVQARWPAEQLRAGAAGEERALVGRVDASLVEWARQLAGLARQPAVRTALLRLGPHHEPLPEGDSKGLEPTVNASKGPPLPLSLPLVEYIAGHPWRDLVAVHDYFYPASDLNLTDREGYLGPNSGRVQVAEFLPVFKPSLQQLGDFVSRALLIRVAYWQGILQCFLVRCQTALQRSQQRGGSRWEAAVEMRRQVQDQYERLQEKCLVCRQARLRHACVALVQVYAAYRPRASLDWLGLPPGVRDVCWIRQRVERYHAVGIGAQVAVALLDVGPLYRQGVDLGAVLEAKCRSHPLVVIMGRGRREVYWCGQLLEVDWCAHSALWDFLALLAEGAKSGQGTDSFDLAGAAPRSWKDRRSRLKGLLPASLNEKICPAGRGTYTLCLGADEVCMLHYQEEERLAEVWGGEGAKP